MGQRFAASDFGEIGLQLAGFFDRHETCPSSFRRRGGVWQPRSTIMAGLRNHIDACLIERSRHAGQRRERLFVEKINVFGPNGVGFDSPG